MATDLDLSGRTKGAGSVMQCAGRLYVWTINDKGRLEAVPIQVVKQKFDDAVEQLEAP